MLSCHIDPFSAFVKDTYIEGCECHLYRGANAFGCLLSGALNQKSIFNGMDFPDWWDTDNVYFLPGVRPGLTKRASDSDVLKRNMFTFDFDIRKNLESANKEPIEESSIEQSSELILQRLCDTPPWDNIRYAVLSGNGLHVHYFGQTVDIVKDQWVAGMKDIFNEINGFCVFPPDFGCGNAGRIMRMPGSWNVKGEPKKPVTVLAWQPNVSIGDMSFVQKRGNHILAKLAEVKKAERTNFAAQHPDGGSDVIEMINRIPIEQVVKKVLHCTVSQEKKDGGLRFIDAAGKERGFFKHHEHNIIVHEGTSLFPAPAGVGYNPLGLVKTVLGMDARAAILWFAERMPAIQEAIEREKREWTEEHKAKEIELGDKKFLLNQ